MISLAAGGKRKLPHATSVVDPTLINSFHELCSSRHQYERAKEEKAAACSMSRPLGPASGQTLASFSLILFHPSTSDSADSSPTVILALITHPAAGGENSSMVSIYGGRWQQEQASSAAANESSTRASAAAAQQMRAARARSSRLEAGM